MITHEAIVRNSAALARRYRLSHEDSFWSPLPMFHIAAILPLVAIFIEGGTYVTLQHFDAGDALKSLEKEQVTCTYPCFWAIMGDLINHPDFEHTDMSCIRLMNANFAVQPPMVGEKMEAALQRRAAVKRTPIANSTSYQVRPGDSLSGIVSRIENRTITMWPAVDLIFAANPDAFMGNDPNRLKAGSWLAIPDLGGSDAAVVADHAPAQAETYEPAANAGTPAAVAAPAGSEIYDTASKMSWAGISRPERTRLQKAFIPTRDSKCWPIIPRKRPLP